MSDSLTKVEVTEGEQAGREQILLPMESIKRGSIGSVG